jgi:ankyrin repeat protein
VCALRSSVANSLDAHADVNCLNVPGSICLARAAYSNHTACVKVLLEANSMIEHWDRGGRNALSTPQPTKPESLASCALTLLGGVPCGAVLSCTGGHEEAAAALIDAGANVNFSGTPEGAEHYSRSVRKVALALPCSRAALAPTREQTVPTFRRCSVV